MWISENMILTALSGDGQKVALVRCTNDIEEIRDLL